MVAVPFDRDETHPGSRDAGRGQHANCAAADHQRRRHARFVLGRTRAALPSPEHCNIQEADRLDHDVREIIIEHAGTQQTGLPTMATR
ncbi:MAG: hypothetical protein OXN97_06525 [Bryobacterales bacterium]|nr:hypothetical protein [Bryobacterales bacterium]